MRRQQLDNAAGGSAAVRSVGKGGVNGSRFGGTSQNQDKRVHMNLCELVQKRDLLEVGMGDNTKNHHAQKHLAKLLSWSSLQRWDFNVFDVVELSGNKPLLFLGWAILGAPQSQYAMMQTVRQNEQDQTNRRSGICKA